MSLADDVFGAVHDEMKNQGQLLRTALRDEINATTMPNRGNLAGELRPQTEREENAVRTTITGVRYALYASSARETVDEGTGPGYWANADAIERWVQTKPGIPRDPDDTEEEVVFLVQASIYQHGTPSPESPVHGLMDWDRRGLERRLPDIVEAIEQRGADVIETSTELTNLDGG